MMSKETDKNQAGDRVVTAYVCMPRPVLRLGSLWVESVQEKHIERIRQWRNAQMDILRQNTSIAYEEQIIYYQKHIWPDMLSAHPKNILVAYMEDDNLIGYGGLVHIEWENFKAEVSFLLNPSLVNSQDNYTRYFSVFLQLMKKLAFQDLAMESLFTETYALRTHHISILEAMGFAREKILKNHVKIEDLWVDSIIHICSKT